MRFRAAAWWIAFLVRRRTRVAGTRDAVAAAARRGAAEARRPAGAVHCRGTRRHGRARASVRRPVRARARTENVRYRRKRSHVRRRQFAGGSSRLAQRAAFRVLAGKVDLRRYSRHLLIPEVGLAGQEKLAAARVLVVGCRRTRLAGARIFGGSRCGPHRHRRRRRRRRDELQRQILYATEDVGKSKARTAAERLHALNPQIALDVLPVRLNASNAREIVRLYDVVVDGTDTFGARYLINDACFLEGKPDVYGSIFRFDGQVSVFAAPGGPCYRCCIPNRRRPNSCRTAPKAACSACSPA